MIKINKPPERTMSRQGLIYVLRERLKELTEADTGVRTKTARQKARALALYRIALVLQIEGVTTSNANKRLPEIARHLAQFIPPKELSGFKKIAKYLPQDEVGKDN